MTGLGDLAEARLLFHSQHMTGKAMTARAVIGLIDWGIEESEWMK